MWSFFLFSSSVYFQIRQRHFTCPTLWKYNFIAGQHFNILVMAFEGTCLRRCSPLISTKLKKKILLRASSHAEETEKWPKTFSKKPSVSEANRSRSCLALLCTKQAGLSADHDYFLWQEFRGWMKVVKIYTCLLAEFAGSWAKSSLHLDKIQRKIFCFLICVVLLNSSWKSRKHFETLFFQIKLPER